MRFRTIVLEVTVQDEEAEILLQAIENAMEKIERQVTVFNSSCDLKEATEPESAAEIAAGN